LDAFRVPRRFIGYAAGPEGVYWTRFTAMGTSRTYFTAHWTDLTPRWGITGAPPQPSPEAAQPGKPPGGDWPCRPARAPEALDGPLRRC